MLRKLVAANLGLLALLLATAVANAWLHGSIAQSLLSSLQVIATNPTVGGDPNDRRAVDFNCTVDASNVNTGFTDANCEQLIHTSINGNNYFGGGTSNKTTFLARSTTGNNYGAGQRILRGEQQNCWGTGDCFLETQNVTYANYPISGDEGTGWQSVSTLQQQPTLDLGSVTSVARSSCNTTLSQSVTGSMTSQAVSVASTTGCVVNDWIVIEQALPTTTPNEEAVQITQVGGGKITGVFVNNHSNSGTVTPATVLTVSMTSGHLAQGRILVNNSGTSYSTGTVATISGGGLTGSGTAWATNIVGGGTTNIGCVALTADDYNGVPFNGSGATGTLKSWYQISSVGSATSLGILTTSVAGDAAYHGYGPGSGGYLIRPCVQVLKFIGDTIAVAETTSTTWSAADSIEQIIPPYPDVNGFFYNMSQYTAGGASRGSRGFLQVTNQGARQYAYAFNAVSSMQTGSNADTVPWAVGYGCSACGIGGSFVNSSTAALQLGALQGSGGTSDNNTKIVWSSTGFSLGGNTATGGMTFQMTTSGTGGALVTKQAGNVGSGDSAQMQFSGLAGTTAVAFAALPTCAAGLEGLMRGVTDSDTATWGATVVHTSGTNHVLAYCDGTNWTVAAK